MSSRRLVAAVFLLFLCGSPLVVAQPIPNWSAPPTWTPPRSTRGARTVQSDVTEPLPFIGVTPCRVLDTRNANGAFGGPIFNAGEVRTYPLSTNPACPGFPPASNIGAYSVNVTVTQTAGTGFVTAYPSSTTRPLVSTVNWVGAGQSVSNAAVVPASSQAFNQGKVDVYASQQTHVIIDVNGYYATAPAIGTSAFRIFTAGHNAILGVTTGSGVNDSAVFGKAASPTGVTDGVWGQSDSSSDFAAGVLATQTATSGMTFGVFGRSSSTATGATGTYGEAVGGTGQIFGVYGVTTSADSSSAGVRGIGGFGAAPQVITGNAGVLGENRVNGAGVIGKAEAFGVEGFRVNSVGVIQSYGVLGSPSAAVYYEGGLAGTGTKSFVEPHPTDASKVIRYVSLEGPEAGTYFRGTEETHGGVAVIQVPESFRLVTDTEGLTVQLTPVGAPAVMYVASQDLDRVEVRSSSDVKFHYTVNGVRKAYPRWVAIQDRGGFLEPKSRSARLPVALSEEERRRLIANGTYNADGTVNMETAERLGWTKVWAEQEARTRANADASKPSSRP